jgi:hypothetical protein
MCMMAQQMPGTVHINGWVYANQVLVSSKTYVML